MPCIGPTRWGSMTSSLPRWRPAMLRLRQPSILPGAPWSKRARRGRPPRLGPVSYTHLRAHETSAHL
eukprot:7915981-Alexandrium_andersonii.AAC.1